MHHLFLNWRCKRIKKDFSIHTLRDKRAQTLAGRMWSKSILLLLDASGCNFPRVLYLLCKDHPSGFCFFVFKKTLFLGYIITYFVVLHSCFLRHIPITAFLPSYIIFLGTEQEVPPLYFSVFCSWKSDFF